MEIFLELKQPLFNSLYLICLATYWKFQLLQEFQTFLWKGIDDIARILQFNHSIKLGKFWESSLDNICFSSCCDFNLVDLCFHFQEVSLLIAEYVNTILSIGILFLKDKPFLFYWGFANFRFRWNLFFNRFHSANQSLFLRFFLFFLKDCDQINRPGLHNFRIYFDIESFFFIEIDLFLFFLFLFLLVYNFFLHQGRIDIIFMLSRVHLL